MMTTSVAGPQPDTILIYCETTDTQLVHHVVCPLPLLFTKNVINNSTRYLTMTTAFRRHTTLTSTQLLLKSDQTVYPAHEAYTHGKSRYYSENSSCAVDSALRAA